MDARPRYGTASAVVRSDLVVFQIGCSEAPICRDTGSMPVPPEAEHLRPVLEALQASGNHPIGQWFMPNQGGWDCEMRQILDIPLLEPLIERDPHRSEIVIADDEVTCLHCKVSIRGPGAAENDLPRRQNG